jgi:acetoin utilization protein AcuB
MKVGSIMTGRVITVGMDDSLEKIGELLENVEFHHLLVVDRGRLVGIVSDRDFLRAISPFLGTLSEQTRDLSTLKKRVHQIMTRKLITVRKGTPIETAAKLLLENNISCLPVTSPHGAVQGIVTWKDILRSYAKK